MPKLSIPLHSGNDGLGVYWRADSFQLAFPLAIAKQEKEMLQVNEERSGELGGGIGITKLLIVLESESMDEVNSAEAKRMALSTAARFGWGNAGLSDNAVVGAVDESTDEIITTLDCPPPKRYRAEFTIAKRL